MQVRDAGPRDGGGTSDILTFFTFLILLSFTASFSGSLLIGGLCIRFLKVGRPTEFGTRKGRFLTIGELCFKSLTEFLRAVRMVASEGGFSEECVGYTRLTAGLRNSALPE